MPNTKESYAILEKLWNHPNRLELLQKLDMRIAFAPHDRTQYLNYVKRGQSLVLSYVDIEMERAEENKMDEIALFDFNKAIELNPYEVLAWYCRIKALIRLAKFDEAETGWEHIADKTMLHEALAFGYLDTNYEKSKEFYKKIDPQNVNDIPVWRRVNLHETLQQWEPASTARTELIRVEPSVNNYRHRANAYEQLGFVDLAIVNGDQKARKHGGI